MDQLLAGATLLALAFLLYQVWQGRQNARRKRQDEAARRRQGHDAAGHPATIPKEVIDQMRQQAPPQQGQPSRSRKRKKR
jgi:hypothetical protein